jgi:hypothetical protein
MISGKTSSPASGRLKLGHRFIGGNRIGERTPPPTSPLLRQIAIPCCIVWVSAARAHEST